MNIAVIGTGNMGQHHVRVYDSIEDVNLVAISDKNEEIGKEVARRYSCNFYNNYKEMLEKEDIDSISIVVPTSLHKKVTLDVLRYNKDILLEKPITDSIKDGEELVNEINKKDIKFMIGHVERFNPIVQRCKKILDEGKIGKLISISAKRVGPHPPPDKDADVITDLAVHDIDVLNFLLDSYPTLISSHGGSTTNRKEDYAEIFLKYNKITSFIQVNWLTPTKIRTLNITGTKGYIELDYIKQKLRMYKKSKDNEELIVEEIVLEKKEPLRLEIESFIDAIKNKKESPLSPEKALNTLKIALNAKRSLIK